MGGEKGQVPRQEGLHMKREGVCFCLPGHAMLSLEERGWPLLLRVSQLGSGNTLTVGGLTPKKLG